MLESDVEGYLVQEVRKAGGECRKLKWIGRNGAPDRRVLLPGLGGLYVELKKPGEKPRPNQLREHALLRRYGERVEVIDSFSSVDVLLAEERHVVLCRMQLERVSS